MKVLGYSSLMFYSSHISQSNILYAPPCMVPYMCRRT